MRTLLGFKKSVPGSAPSTGRSEYAVTTERTIEAYVVESVPSSRPVPPLDARKQLAVLKPILQERTMRVWQWRNHPNEKIQMEVEPHGLFRFYAAQVDAADASHFAIDYALDGEPGTIDGWLKDNDKLLLQPRTGNVENYRIGSRDELAWNPLTGAATRPTRNP